MSRSAILVFFLACALGCASAPENAIPPRPEDGLASARAEAARAATPQEEARLRRAILQRCLSLGWTQEASTEYLRLEVLGSGDPGLLRELCLATLRWALRDIDPARRLSALRVARDASELPAAERLALAEIGARDRRAEVRAGAQRVLQELEDERSAGILQGAFADPAPLVRLAALEGLLARSIQPDDALARACQDPAPALRRRALGALAGRPLTTATRALLPSLLRHGDLGTARAAALAWSNHSPAEARDAWAETAPLDAVGRALLTGLRYRAGGSSVELQRLLRQQPSAEVCLAALAPLRGARPGQLDAPADLERPLLDLIKGHPATAARREALERLRALGSDSVRLERALLALLESDSLHQRRLALRALRRPPRARLEDFLRDPGLADLAARRLEPLLPREEWREAIVAALETPARETLLPLALELEGGRELALELLESPTRGRLRSLGLQALIGDVIPDDLALLLPHLTRDRDEDLYAATLALALLRQTKGKTATLPN
jgi:hypothetical protein